MILTSKDLTYKHLSYPDIEILEDRVNFIHGPSGSGKTTLLKLLNKSISPDGGKIFFKGDDLEKLNSIELRKNITLCGQSSFLFPGTIYDNFKEFYSLREEDLPSKDYMRKILDLCQIDFNLNKDTYNLSGGEKQRVFIAFILSFKPEIILLDEPTSALDDNTAYRLMENIIDYSNKNKISMVVVSHNDGIIEKFSENNIYIGDKNE